MTPFSFKILAEEGRARTGRITTPHGLIETPAFVPVATLGAVKNLPASELKHIGVQVIIANGFHLDLQPGEDLIREMGGLHRFLGWDKPIMIDSGGFQVFSLGAAKVHGVGKIASVFPEEQDRGGHLKAQKGKPLVKIDEGGVEFTSYRDGSPHRLTPEGVVTWGLSLGADLIMVLDECTSPLHDVRETREAMERTHRWAGRSLREFQGRPSAGRALFGIVQGGAFQDLRQESARFIAGQGFDGYAIGGSLGKSKRDMAQVLDWTIPLLPEEKPRHLLGVGMVDDIFEVVRRGCDLFDCIVPTRLAATGTFLAREAKRFRVHILNEAFKKDHRPIEENCSCSCCRNHSRAFLRHLFQVKEPLAVYLAAVHNLHFMETLMGAIRSAIGQGGFERLRVSWNEGGIIT